MSKIKDKISKAVAKIKSIKHIEIAIAVIAVVIMLLIYFGTSCSPKEKTGIEQSKSEYDYCTDTVRQLEAKLAQIEGVGEVSVLVNWTTDTEVTNTDTVSFPKPEGVIIICEGGNNLSVKLKLISSVASYFGISENKINVLAKSK